MTLLSQSSFRRQKVVRAPQAAISLQWRRNKQSTIAPVRLSYEDMFTFDTQNVF
jgi:hypothetical protein